MWTKTFTRVVAIALAMAVGALSLPATAEAGHKHRRHGAHVSVGHHHSYRHRHYRKSRNHHGAAIAAGILGIAVGAAIVGSANRHYHDPHRYRARHAPRRAYHPQRHHRGHAPTRYSGAWYRYCAAKYRSFDAASGTYLTYSGVRKICR